MFIKLTAKKIIIFLADIWKHKEHEPYVYKANAALMDNPIKVL